MTNAIANMTAQIAAATAAAPAAAAPAKARTKRAAQPKVESKASVVSAAAKKIGVKYVITGARPTAGKHLYAHTAAVLMLTGMTEGKAVDRAVLVDMLGQKAVDYHLGTTTAFAPTKAGIEINGEFGMLRMFNSKRAYDPKDFEAYVSILTTGKADDRLVKNQGMIRAVKTV